MSYDALKIALVEHDVSWADVGDNILTVADSLNRVSRDTDLVILPELFSTGFVTDITQAHDLAEETDGKTMDAIHRWAKFFGFAIAGSMLIKEGGNLYNRGFIVEPSGDHTFYDKRHLFTMGGEGRVYNRGNRSIPVVRFRGWDIAIAICYDLRFPEWLLNRGCRYDLLIIPANWPESRIYAWEQLILARAIENVAYVAGCNRQGSDDAGVYPGNSIASDFKGNVITMPSNRPNIFYASLRKAPLLTFREKFPVWKDFD